MTPSPKQLAARKAFAARARAGTLRRKATSAKKVKAPKKKRSAAQIAATRKMLAARFGGKASVTQRTYNPDFGQASSISEEGLDGPPKRRLKRATVVRRKVVKAVQAAVTDALTPAPRKARRTKTLRQGGTRDPYQSNTPGVAGRYSNADGPGFF